MSGHPPTPSSYQPDQVQSIPLSNLQPGHENKSICVRASRVCHYRGDPEDGEVTELRIVFLDAKGNSIYAIVPHDLVRFNIHVLHETGMYDITAFEVSSQQQSMKPIENPLVITIGELTKVQLILPQDYPKNFPEWAYRLTPISNLPEPTGTLRQYIDVIGVICSVSDVATLTVSGRNILVSRRHVLIDDGSGNRVRVILWGEAAFRFNGRVIRFLGDDWSTAVIFVALTISMVQGSQELSGSSSCRWYINEDIEETNVLQASILSMRQPIKHLPKPRQMTLRPAFDFTRPVEQLSVLLGDNPLPQQPTRFRCVVQIWRLTPETTWWFARCINCLRPAVPAASPPNQTAKYTCLNVGCPCAGVTIEYKPGGRSLYSGANVSLILCQR